MIQTDVYKERGFSSLFFYAAKCCLGMIFFGQWLKCMIERRYLYQDEKRHEMASEMMTEAFQDYV